MKLDKDSRKLSKQLFQASFTDGRIDGAKVATIGRKVADSKPRNSLGILKEFQRLIRLEVEKHHAVIESAAALDDGTKKQLLANLQSKYGNDLTTEFKVSPELLGGLRIKIGSDVFDSSVRERLNRLESEFTYA
jgi:F-type H+-transporting ATPase subunit delta